MAIINLGLVPYLLLLIGSVLGSSLMSLVPSERQFFQRYNRLNFDYYIRDDEQRHGGTAKRPLVVRLGNAHYWHEAQCILPLPVLSGHTFAVHRSAHLPNKGELAKPVATLTYQIPRELAQQHFVEQLMPAMFFESGWCEEDEVLGVSASMPVNVFAMVAISIDLAQGPSSTLPFTIMYLFRQRFII